MSGPPWRQGYTLALARRDSGQSDLSSGGSMTEILTESFCERCGTRYTFESAAPRKSRLGRVRTLSKGVKNFVLSDDSSFSEAMAEARSEEELTATSHQLDAFHQTFNFCLTCRQYTCGDCWNVAEGRCLTCAPLPGQAEPVTPSELGALLPEALEVAANGNGHEPEDLGVEAWPELDLPAEAWPEMDLPADRLARVLDLAPEPAQVEAAGTAAFEAAGTSADEVVAQVEEAVVEHEAVSESMLIGVAPGQSLDDAIAEYEARIAAEEAALNVAGAESAIDEQTLPAVDTAGIVEPETVEAVAAAPEPEPVAAAPQPEPVTAWPEPEPEPVIAASPEPEPEPIAASPAPTDHVAQPTWPVVPPPAVQVPSTPVVPAATPNPWLTVAPDDNAAPQWPTAPQWPAPAARRDTPTGIAGRPFLPQAEASALWAASNQEVLGAAPAPLPGIATVAQAQPCVSCGLSLSANARFCRRCGTRQA